MQGVVGPGGAESAVERTVGVERFACAVGKCRAYLALQATDEQTVEDLARLV